MSNLLPILHQADGCINQFKSAHSRSFQLVSSVATAQTQMDNLVSVGDKLKDQQTPSTRERTMTKLQDHQNSALEGVREELAKMEQICDELRNLLFQADVYLAESQTALQHGLNPTEALRHVSTTFEMLIAEMLSKREILADYTCEDINANEFKERWRSASEIVRVEQEADDELSNMFSGI